MATNPSEENDMDENEASALRRLEKLKQLKFRPLYSSRDKISRKTKSAYKRRGVELKYLPHSTEKIAKDFDDKI